MRWKISSQQKSRWRRVTVIMDDKIIAIANVFTDGTMVKVHDGHPIQETHKKIFDLPWGLTDQEVMQLAWLPDEYGICSYSGEITRHRCGTCGRFVSKRFINDGGCLVCTFHCFVCNHRHLKVGRCRHCDRYNCPVVDGAATICRSCIKRRITWRKI